MVSNLEDMALGFTIERAGAADFVADMTGARGGARLECLCLCGGGGGGWSSGGGSGRRAGGESRPRRRILKTGAPPPHHLPTATSPHLPQRPLTSRRPPLPPAPFATTAMLPRLRSPLTRCAAAARPLARLYSQTVHPSITTPNTPTAPNASATNATLAGDLQEPVLEAEHKRHMQAPNRPTTWSRSQRPRELGMVGPRFEQTTIEHQVRISSPSLPLAHH